MAGQQVVAEVLQGAATGHPGVGEHVEIPPVNSLKHNALAVDPQVPQLEIQTSLVPTIGIYHSHRRELGGQDMMR